MVDGPDTAAWVEAYNDQPGDQTAAYLASDFQEQQKFTQFYPQNGSNWWENLAVYGATRAIDSHFAPSAVDKTAAGASYAGQNGRTYTAGAAQTGAGGNGLVLLLLAVGAFVALN